MIPVKPSLLFCLLPALAFASKGASVPVPKDSQGRSPALAKSMVMDDGTWVVTDTSGRLWWTRSLGAQWDTVPDFARGDRGGQFGLAVVTRNNTSYWSYDGGWKSALVPAECLDGKNRYTHSDGFWGTYDDKSKKITYCRSTDGLRKWNLWFSPPNASLPEDTLRWIGDGWNGKIWYKMVDSGYMRGTDNGLDWTRIALPPGFRVMSFMPETPGGSELVLVGGESWLHATQVAISKDMGATWEIHPGSELGWMVRKLSNSLFFAVAIDSIEGRSHGVSNARTGPWTKLDTAFRGYLFKGDDAYVVEEHAIYKLVLDGVGRMPKPAASHWQIRSENGRRVVDLPSALGGSAWSLRSLYGRKMASGRAVGERIELPVGVGGGLLLVGSQVRLVPGFDR